MSAVPALGRLGMAAVLAAVVGGCSSSSNISLNPISWFAEDRRPKPAPLPELKSTVPVRTLWQATVGSGADLQFVPAVTAGAVFAAAADGTVARFDAASGAQRWRVRLSVRLSGGVGAGGGVVVVGTAEGVVIGLDADSGVERWKVRVSSEVLAAPVITDDLVVVRSTDARIFGLDALDGRRRWVYQRTLPPLTVRTAAGVSARGSTIYVGFPGGRLVALASGNGAVRWEGAVSLPKGTTELERVTDVVGLPWVSDREVCAVAYQGRAACFDAGKGSGFWARELSSSAGLGADARYVFVSDDRGTVHALDRSSGNSIWKQDRLSLRNLTAPVPLGNVIMVADLQGFVHLLSRDNGAFVGRAATDGSPVVSPPVVIPGGVLVQTRSGGLFALSIQ